MNEHLRYPWEEAQRQDAGEDELERSGSESSPAARSPEGGQEGGLEEEPCEPEQQPEDIEEERSGLGANEKQIAWDEDPGLSAVRLGARRRGYTLAKKRAAPTAPPTPEQRLLLLDTWQRSGLAATEFAQLVGLSPHTLRSWRQRFDEHGPAGLMDAPRGGPRGSRLAEVTKRTILMLKEAHPDWGCQRISDMLFRGPALPASPSAIARVLHEAGYQMEEVATRPHPQKVQSFERARPNQLWQTDLFTFVLKRQNRRLYLVAFLDDRSRFVTGYGLHASQSSALVIEVLRAALTSNGVPEEILTDNGSQYVTWRGKSQFARELEKRGIRQIVAKPKRPQTLGKIERFWGTLWRECIETAIFRDLEDARLRVGLFIDHYNFQRAHQGINGLVPADRFFGAAPEVLKTLKERVAANALELARHGMPKQPFYLTGQLEGKPFSVHREGDRVILRRAGQQREEIELMPPEDAAPREVASDPMPPAEHQELPEPVCPDGSPESRWQAPDTELPPGANALEELGAYQGESPMNETTAPGHGVHEAPTDEAHGSPEGGAS